MGNDGGSIPHRTEVVKTKQKEERKDQFEMARAKSRLCAMSKEPLREPIAVCRLGLLYNKEYVIKKLIEKSVPHAFRHIKKLKDIKEAKVQVRPTDDNNIVIICPVSQIELNGFHPFQMPWGCGCIFSEEAAKELGGLKDQCISCGTKIDNKNDVISLNQSPDDQLAYLRDFDEQQKALEDKVNKKKEKKNAKKRLHRDLDGAGGQDPALIEPVDMIKRQKTDNGTGKPEKSEAYKSLFAKQYEENKDADFLCRCVHRGLR